MHASEHSRTYMLACMCTHALIRTPSRAQLRSRLKALDQQVKLAISHALAQSSKLSVYETRVADLVEQVWA